LRPARQLRFQFLDLTGELVPLPGDLGKLLACITIRCNRAHAFAVGGLIEAFLYLRRFHVPNPLNELSGVARIERSEMREEFPARSLDFASLNPGCP
jgi:hypothetical protein